MKTNPDLILAQQLEIELNKIKPLEHWGFTTKLDICACTKCSGILIAVSLDTDGDFTVEGSEMGKTLTIEEVREAKDMATVATKLLKEIQPIVDFVNSTKKPDGWKPE